MTSTDRFRIPFPGLHASLLLLGLVGPLAAQGEVTLVSGNATPGFYNTSLGDLGAPSGNLPWFPAPNTFSGTTEIFGEEPDLSGAAAALGNWFGDPANLNVNWSAVSAIPQTWAVNTEVAILYVIDAGPGLTDITASFDRIDNGIHIWVNGVWKFGARDPAGRAWTDIALGQVGAGTSYIQILLEDSGGATAYTGPQITATVVPLPATLWLLGAALLGLFGPRCARVRALLTGCQPGLPKP